MIRKNLKNIPYWRAGVMFNGEPKVAIFTHHDMKDVITPHKIEADMTFFNVPDKLLMMWAETGENILDSSQGDCRVIKIDEVMPCDSDSGFDDWIQNK